MKTRLSILILIATFLLPITLTGAVSQATTGYVIPKGTLVKIRLDQNLGTKTNKTGEMVAFSVVDPVYIKGTKVIKEGALAAAQLKKVRGPGRFGRDASLKINYLFVVGANRTEIPIALGEKSIKTNESMGFAAGASAAGFMIFGPVGILGSGLVKGKHIDIPAGTELMVEVPHDTRL